MKLNEVLQDEAVLRGDMWVRPTTWKGRNSAYTVKDKAVFIVPTSSGGSIGITPYITELTSDWEIVDPDKVLGGL